MNYLILINDFSEIKHSVAYAKLLSTDEDSMTVLAIVPSTGDVPVKLNGQVLDVCTEFDLSPLRVIQAEYRQALDQHLRGSAWTSEVLVGDRARIIEERIKELDPHVILLATELTSEAKDHVFISHATQLYRKIDRPILTYKCDRSQEAIEHIAIISDFEHDFEIDLSVVKQITKVAKAELSLFSIVGEEVAREEQERRMTQFMSVHGLDPIRRHVVVSGHKEEAIRELLTQFEMQLMVLLDLHRHGVKSVLFGDLERDVLNHTSVPILAY